MRIWAIPVLLALDLYTVYSDQLMEKYNMKFPD